jgi:hypothetical protein
VKRAISFALLALGVAAVASSAPAKEIAAGFHAEAGLLVSGDRAPAAEPLAAIRWSGRRYATGDGSSVDVRVSAAYAGDPGAARRWADFFASLVHGPELGLLRAYVAPLDEVRAICRADALGCYGDNQLVTIGDASGGIAPESVAAHEYGHHVANNRVNPPWRAIDWGAKRWASAMDICARAAQGTAFPGDEGSEYQLNPGEAFAESYRVLNERDRGLPFSWPIVDPSFIPSDATLASLREDVLTPWSAPTTRTVRVRFLPGRRVWSTRLSTPLDGELTLTVRGAFDVRLVEGGRSVAQAEWSSGGGRSLAYRVCGDRSLDLRVTRGGSARNVALRLTQP